MVVTSALGAPPDCLLSWGVLPVPLPVVSGRQLQLPAAKGWMCLRFDP